MALNVISRTFIGTTPGVLNFRAPKNMMYIVKGFQLSNFAESSNRLIISSKMEEELELLADDSNSIFGIDLLIDGLVTSEYFPDDGVETKFIAIGFINDLNAAVTVKVYYQLKRATNVELIWEFLKRGKNP